MRPYFVGIAGPSCSGKSLLAKQLAIAYSDKNSHVLSLDSYYCDLSGMDPSERDRRNFDMPDAIDVALFLEHLEILLAGGEIEKPVYDFKTHTRAAFTHRVASAEFIIVEGLFTLYWERVREIIQTRVFVNIPEEMLLSRRLYRDVKERGRSPDQVLLQYQDSVRPMNETYVLPTSEFADLVVCGVEPVESLVAKIRSRIDHYFCSGQGNAALG